MEYRDPKTESADPYRGGSCENTRVDAPDKQQEQDARNQKADDLGGLQTPKLTRLQWRSEMRRPHQTG